MEPIKPGFKTTEFWLSAAAVAFFAYIGVPETASVKVKIATVIAALFVALGYGKFRNDRKLAEIEVRPSAPPSAGFAHLKLLFVLTLIAVLFSGCAWLKSEQATAVAIAGDVAHCASDGAIAAVGPLAATLAEAALHGGEADWQGELVRLETSAREFRDCVILAALNRITTDPVVMHVPTSGPGMIAVRYRPLRAEDQVHPAPQVEQAKIRLRAALKTP